MLPGERPGGAGGLGWGFPSIQWRTANPSRSGGSQSQRELNSEGLNAHTGRALNVVILPMLLYTLLGKAFIVDAVFVAGEFNYGYFPRRTWLSKKECLRVAAVCAAT